MPETHLSPVPSSGVFVRHDFLAPDESELPVAHELPQVQVEQRVVAQVELDGPDDAGKEAAVLLQHDATPRRVQGTDPTLV